MPRMPPPAHSRFQPGQSGNPAGKPKYRLTAEELRKIINKYAFMKRADLQRAIQNDETPMMELWVASIIATGAKLGDWTRFAALLDRSIGKPGPDTAIDQVRESLAAMSKEQLIEKMEADLRRMKEAS